MKARNWNLLVLGIIAAALGYAAMHWHAVDDAFITFRYSHNLAQGHGPVWNLDQRVEGYSNFLWMVLMAVPIALGSDPVLPSGLMGLACLGLNLWISYLIAQRLTLDPARAFWIWLPLAFNHTLLMFATSGLETSMNGLVWTTAFWMVMEVSQGRLGPRPIILGCLLGLAVLSRPEGPLLVLAALVALVWLPQQRLKHRDWLGVIIPLALLVTPWVAWKWHFYGGLLPNTFHIKTAETNVWEGIRYVALFFLSSGVWVGLLGLGGWRKLEGSRRKILAWGTGITVIFIGYSLWVGGDYLEFRLLTPVISLALLLSTWLATHGRLNAWRVRGTAALVCLLGLMWGQGHGRLFDLPGLDSAIHPVSSSDRFLSMEAQGKELGRIFDHDPTLRFAIGSCGAIPYYTGFYGIDLYGLNEPSASFTARPTGFGPGHARIADLAYLAQRAPHLLSLRCEYLAAETARSYGTDDPQVVEILGRELPQGWAQHAKVVEIPLKDGFHEICLYLSPHPKVEELLKNNVLKIYALEYR